MLTSREQKVAKIVTQYARRKCPTIASGISCKEGHLSDKDCCECMARFLLLQIEPEIRKETLEQVEEFFLSYSFYSECKDECPYNLPWGCSLNHPLKNCPAWLKFREYDVT